MNFEEEECENEIKWEEVEDVKEVSESTMKAFYQEFQVRKNEHELLLNQQKELLAKLNEEIAEKKSLKKDLEIAQQNYYSICTTSDEINKIANSKIKTKAKTDPSFIKETKDQIAERNTLTKEIELANQRLQLKKKALHEEEMKIETELKRQRVKYESIMKQAEVLKAQIAIFSNDAEDADYSYSYEEEEDGNEQAKNGEDMNKNNRVEDEPAKAGKPLRSCDILSVPKPQPKQETRDFPKCKDPNIHAYKLSFSYIPSGIPESKDSKKLVFPSGEDIVVCKGGNKIIHAKDFTLIVYASGDVLQKFPDGTTAYKYKETNAVEIDMPDTTKVTLFANSQVEIRFPNGDFKVQFPDNSIKYIRKNGETQTTSPDGTITYSQ